MIIKNTATLREHLAVNNSVEIINLQPYLKKAERSFLRPNIGGEQLQFFENLTTPEGVEKEALELAREVVANYAYYLYLPILAVQITDSGIQVVDNENTKMATDKQYKELQRSFLTSAHEALDELLAFMELHSVEFPKWVTSNCYSVYKNLLVNTTDIFNSHYYIFNSRQTFIALKSKIKMVEDRFISGAIGSGLLLALYDKQTDVVRKKVKELLQKSVVAFTIMDVLDSGMFVLDAQGMRMRFDMLPYEKLVTKEFKVNSQFKENKKIEGEEYLKMALAMIRGNSPNFPEFLLPKKTKKKQLIKTKGIIGV